MRCRWGPRIYYLRRKSEAPFAPQYPSEQSEDGKYYSGYDDKVHEGQSYTGYSIWVRLPSFYGPSGLRTSCYAQDIYRAEWAWLILFAPERLPAMITSMLQDYEEVRYAAVLQLPFNWSKHRRQSGWLPMWKNIVGEIFPAMPSIRWSNSVCRNKHHGKSEPFFLSWAKTLLLGWNTCRLTDSRSRHQRHYWFQSWKSIWGCVQRCNRSSG